MKRGLFILYILSSLTAIGQNYSGIVKDSNTLEVLPFSNVMWLGHQTGVVSNADGEFAIRRIKGDTLIISVIGYQDLKVSEFDLPHDGSVYMSKTAEALEDVNIKVKKRKRRKRKEDPAYLLHKKIADNRNKNNLKSNSQYSAEVYNKIRVALNNVDSNTKDLLLFKPISFVFDHPDTSSRKKAFSPIFISEGYSQCHYKSPTKEKEVIVAAKNAGIQIPSIAQYTGNIYMDLNFYNNYVRIFQKQFISPLAQSSWLSYKYFLTDSVIKNDTVFYKLEFRPRRKQDLAFEGFLTVDDKSFAINEIQCRIPKKCNINYIEEFQITQNFAQKDSVLVLETEDVLIDVNPWEKVYGFYIDKHTEWINVSIKDSINDNIFRSAQRTVVNDSAYQKGEELLNKLRPHALSVIDKAIYQDVNKAMNTRYLRTIQNLSQMAYIGYYPLKYWEYGPYYTTYSFNSFEGDRVRVGFQSTQALLNNWRIRGHVAHGMNDNITKFGGVLTKYYGFKKWRYVEFEYLNDYRILSSSDNAFKEDNIIASLTRRVDPRFTHVKRGRLIWSHEWYNGINNFIEIKADNLKSLGTLTYFTPDNNPLEELNFYTLKIGGRLAIDEKFIRYGFRRLSLGTTKPRFDYGFTQGVAYNNDGYEFKKLEIEMTDRYFLGFFGFVDLKIKTGKIWGELPYPELINHQGNDSYYYDSDAFNLMNPFEFVSDQHVSAKLKYNFNGLILNRVPVMKRLKLRSFIFANSAYGTLKEDHERVVVLPEGLSPLKEPYLETGFGVENIFKLIRLDFIWRMTNLDSPNAQKFGITFDIVPNF